MAAHQVEKDCWPQYLAPQLKGRAQLVFAALSGHEEEVCSRSLVTLQDGVRTIGHC